MKVRIEPKPLHEPLAGGTPGATVTVEPIVAGRVTWPRTMMERPGGRFETLKLLRALLSGEPAATVPVPGLPDPPPQRRRDPRRHRPAPLDRHRRQGELRRPRHPRRQPRLEAGEDVPAQLRKRGLDAGEIPIVVMTHMHIDHTSAISEFPNSTFVVSETEWEAAATGPRPLLNGYRRPHFDYAFDYRTVDFDRGGIDSYATFGRTFDLFGDGSIRLAYTPGHSAGHMSVIAHLAERDFVIGGDATYTQAQLDGDAPLAPRPFDAHNYRRSLQELKLFRREYPGRDRHPGPRPRVLRRAQRPLRVADSPLNATYISRTGAKICSATSSWRSRLGVLLGREGERLAELHGHLGEAEALPAPHLLRALDRDGHDRRPRFERDPTDPRLDLAQLAAARAAALGVDEQHLPLLEDREGGLDRLLVVVAAAHREDAAVLVDVGEDGRAEHLRLGHEAHLAPQQ